MHPVFRSWSRAPGLSLLLVAVLAVGMGAATAGVAVADRVLVNPFGLPQPARLVHIFDSGTPEVAAAYARLPTFAAVCGISTGVVDGRNLAAVTTGFFGVAGVAPRQGRGFSAQEQDAGSHVAVVAASLHTEFGQTIKVAGHPFVVIGVMPAGFSFPRGTEVWIPALAPQSEFILTGGSLHSLTARLRAGVAMSAARAEVLVQQQREAEGPRGSGWRWWSSR